ncbi:TPA: hypothetical protein NJ811_004539 [Vibrio parahaemolyticus]|nr:hypothetical protein [Vibrio parahaemolyticus]HCG9630976.1 hypothetical protein [Vibrio parahaemolyticus]
MAHAKILKYSTKLLAENAEAKGTTAKLELTLKTQVGEKKNMQRYPISPLSNLQRIQAAELNGSAKENPC